MTRMATGRRGNDPHQPRLPLVDFSSSELLEAVEAGASTACMSMLGQVYTKPEGGSAGRLDSSSLATGMEACWLDILGLCKGGFGGEFYRPDGIQKT